MQGTSTCINIRLWGRDLLRERATSSKHRRHQHDSSTALLHCTALSVATSSSGPDSQLL